MEEELAEKIIRELIKFSPKKYAICNTSGFVLAQTKDFSIEHNPLDIKGTKAAPIYFEKRKLGYLYLDEKISVTKDFLDAARSMTELIIQESFFSRYLNDDEKKLDQVIYNFLQNNEPAPKELKRILNSFEIDITANRLAILIEIVDPEYLFLYKKEVIEGEREQKVKRIKNGLKDVFKTFYTRHGDNVVVYLGSCNFLVLKDMGDSPEGYQKEFKKSLSSLFYDIEQELRTKITIGVGDYKKNIAGIRESFEEAQTAVAFGKQIWGEGRIYHYDNFGVVAPLFSGANSENIAFSKKIIAKLQEMPALYKSIDEYFKQNLSLSKTSKALKIHRNTLVYRLEKITEVTGLDPRVFNEAFQLYIALILEKYNE